MKEQDDVLFMECLSKPKNEDMTCSDNSFPETIWPTDFSKYIKQHGRYYGVEVGASKLSHLIFLFRVSRLLVWRANDLQKFRNLVRLPIFIKIL
jgi:hypothetical protein